MFLDDRKHNLFVCVVSFNDVFTTPAIPKVSITTLPNGTGVHSPLDIPAFLVLLAIFPSKKPQNGLSESPIPLTGFPRGSKNEEGGQGAHDRNPPLELNPKSKVVPTSNPNRSGDLVDPSEIGMNDVPARPGDGSTGDLRNHITDGSHEGQPERDEAQHHETDVQGGGEER